MKILFKILKISIILIPILILFYAFEIYLGYAPVPKFITNIIANRQGLSDKESVDFNKVVNLYQIIKRDNKEQVKEFQIVVVSGASQDSISDFLKNSYSKISDKTFEKIKNQLGMDSSDFYKAKEILEINIKDSVMSDAQRDTLMVIREKYGITETLIEKLLNFSSK